MNKRRWMVKNTWMESRTFVVVPRRNVIFHTRIKSRHKNFSRTFFPSFLVRILSLVQNSFLAIQCTIKILLPFFFPFLSHSFLIFLSFVSLFFLPFPFLPFSRLSWLIREQKQNFHSYTKHNKTSSFFSFCVDGSKFFLSSLLLLLLFFLLLPFTVTSSLVITSAQ